MHTDFGTLLDKSLLALNLVFGAILFEHLNMLVAGLGMLSTLVVNLPKVISSVLWIRDLRRNKWKLPKQPHEDTATK